MTFDEVKQKYRECCADARPHLDFVVPRLGRDIQLGEQVTIVPGLVGKAGMRWFSYVKVRVPRAVLKAYLEAQSPNPTCPACTFGIFPHHCFLR